MPKWYKSSYSGTSSDCVEVAHDPWQKSSYSGTSTNCVEVDDLGYTTGIRDTKNRDLGALFFSTDEWQAFLTPAQHSKR